MAVSETFRISRAKMSNAGADAGAGVCDAGGTKEDNDGATAPSQLSVRTHSSFPSA